MRLKQKIGFVKVCYNKKMNSQKNLSTKIIQSELEDWIYKMNSAGILQGRYHLIFNGYEEGLGKLGEEGLDRLEEEYSETDEFYSKQFAHQPRASIAIEMEVIKNVPHSTVYDRPVPKIVCFLTPGKIEKEVFEKFVGLGWKIHGYPFKYVFKQEDIFHTDSKIADFFSKTLSLLEQYNWELELVNETL